VKLLFLSFNIDASQTTPKDSLEVLIGPITRSMTKFKDSFNRLIQSTKVKMNFK
jgi:hypothetical protein